METTRERIEKLIHRYDTLAKASGIFTIIIGFFILLQQNLIVPQIKILSFIKPIEPSTGISFVLIGLSLLLLLKAKTHPRLMNIQAALMVFVFLNALLNLSAHMIPYDFEIGHFLKMPVLICINCMLSSCALVLLKFPNNKFMWIKPFLAVIIFLIGSMSFLEYTYEVNTQFGIAKFIEMPLYLSITFIVLSMGLFFVEPEYGITRIFLLDCKGGRLARRLFPAAILIPPLLDAITLIGQHLGLYDNEYRLIVVCVAFIILFSGLILFVAHYLQSLEAKHDIISGQLEYLKNDTLTQRKKTMEIVSTIDQLTGLANRNYFLNLLEHSIRRGHRSKILICVLYVNLDHFKNVNTTFLHGTGDQVLIEFGKRLRNVLREVDTVARLSDDEFAIILEDPLDVQSVVIIANRLKATFQSPFMIKENQITQTASIGIGCYPKDGADIRSLVTNASVAMRRVKKAGGNDFQFFDKESNKFIKECE